MSEDQVRQKVVGMAKLSVLTDRISEVHEKNLKMYPFVFFNGVSKAEISYDLSNNLGVSDKLEKDKDKNYQLDYKLEAPETKHLRVSYHLTLDERLNGNLDKRFKAIEDSIRNLFWKQVSVEIFFNSELKYKSKNV